MVESKSVVGYRTAPIQVKAGDLNLSINQKDKRLMPDHFVIMRT